MQLKVNSGLRSLWPFLAIMYMTICCANDLVDVIVLKGDVHNNYMLWVVFEPAAVGFILVCALRVPRHSLSADCVFLLGIYANLILDLISSANSLDLNSHLHAHTVVRHVMWYFAVVSMFVFAGFHFVPIILFWVASVVFLMFGYQGKYHNDYRLAMIVAIVCGIVIGGVASVIERHMTWQSEVAEKHRNAERILLEYATNGTCVVESQAGTLAHTSPNLQEILGPPGNGTSLFQDLVIPEDKGRTQALLEDANLGQLGATVVTLSLLKDTSDGQLQDVRLIAYSASRSEVMVCMQFLGESRPRAAHASDNASNRVGQGSAPRQQMDVMFELNPMTPEHTEGRYLDPLAGGEISPPASQAGSASQVTAPFAAVGHQAEILTTAVGLLHAVQSPRSISSQGTLPLPSAIADMGSSRTYAPALVDRGHSSNISPIANTLHAPLISRAA